jgi:membrane-bound lytic murein transglycosylase B
VSQPDDLATMPRLRSVATLALVAIAGGLFVTTAFAASRAQQRWVPGVVDSIAAPPSGSDPLPGAERAAAGGAVELMASGVGVPSPQPTSAGIAAVTPLTPTTVRIVDPAWVAEFAARAHIPAPAIRAYATAVLDLQDEQPACRLGWTTLAAIGQMESGNGTWHGAQLREDGTTTVPIVGPALSGGPDHAAIPASALGTSLHGDPTWEHAVGPMQFLPSTWKRWAADGDRDGIANPNDLDDAALAAARYLCASGADLSTGPGWQRAVLSYNHSDSYVEAIRAIATAIAAT